MNKKISEENIQKLVKATLESPFSMIKMLKKHGHKAAHRIEHGQLHLDFDDRTNNSWNMDIISLFPTDQPVAMTSWKGIIYVHYLEEPPVNQTKNFAFPARLTNSTKNGTKEVRNHYECHRGFD